MIDGSIPEFQREPKPKAIRESAITEQEKPVEDAPSQASSDLSQASVTQKGVTPRASLLIFFKRFFWDPLC